MNISNWGIGKIMQLPDWCFGRRFLVSLAAEDSGFGDVFDISEIALADKAVLWNVSVTWSFAASALSYYKLALGDQLPPAWAMMNAQEPLIPGLGMQGAGPREVQPVGYTGQISLPLRYPIDAQGRRPVLGLHNAAVGLSRIQVQLTFSSVPTEAPDWLVSE